MNQKNFKKLYKAYKESCKKGEFSQLNEDDWETLLVYLEEMNQDEEYNQALKYAINSNPDNLLFQVLQACRVGEYSKVEQLTTSSVEAVKSPEMMGYRILGKLLNHEEAQVLKLLHNLEQTEESVLFNQVFPYFLFSKFYEENYTNNINFTLSLDQNFPNNKDILFWLLTTYHKEGAFELAMERAEQLSLLYPYSAEIWYATGILFEENKQFGAAADAYSMAAICDKSNKAYAFLHGFCAMKSEDFKQAINVFEELIKDSEYYAQTTPLLLRCYIRDNQLDRASKFLKKEYQTMKKVSPQLLVYSEIDLQLRCGKIKIAQELIASALQKYPANDLLFFNIEDEYECNVFSRKIDKKIRSTQDYTENDTFFTFGWEDTTPIRFLNRVEKELVESTINNDKFLIN